MFKHCHVDDKLWILWSCILIAFASALTPEVREEDARSICECGSSAKPLQTRVVGGRNAARGDFPYATGLMLSYGRSLPIFGFSDYIPYCGGTLITDRHVVTAAHCVRDRTPRDITVDVGEYNIVDKEEARIIRNVKSFVKHPEYVSKTFRNDIALIELSSPVKLNSKLKAAWLAPQDTDLSPGTPVTVYGWGRLDYDNNGRPKILQMLQMPVVSRSDCQKRLLTHITSNMLCAGGEKGRDACIGDSGSGLTTKQKGENVLVGLVSFGRRCALPGIAGVYTRVGGFTDWIYENTRNSNCQPCIVSEEDFFENSANFSTADTDD